MTKEEEFEALWEQSGKRAERDKEEFETWYNSLSQSEKEKVDRETENSRLWEDYTGER